MTTVLLIRHAMTDAAGVVLAGRRAGIHLNATGRRQARALPARLELALPSAIYSSPLERAIETASPLAEHCRLAVHARAALTELDFGEWTGCRIDALAGDARWQRFNTYRSGTRIPGGESMLEAQARVTGELAALRCAHAGKTIAVVTHGDVIRAALAHYAGAPLDHLLRLDIQPASISIVRIGDDQPRILLLNELGAVSPGNVMIG
jgi:broad specificity phosphatase PhoE